eukprot:m.176301 g.176301  ORF g.176301 m.176301 type:complete len:61 (+) comp15337_c25_seq2:698-880(+)
MLWLWGCFFLCQCGSLPTVPLLVFFFFFFSLFDNVQNRSSCSCILVRNCLAVLRLSLFVT